MFSFLMIWPIKNWQANDHTKKRCFIIFKRLIVGYYPVWVVGPHGVAFLRGRWRKFGLHVSTQRNSCFSIKGSSSAWIWGRRSSMIYSHPESSFNALWSSGVKNAYKKQSIGENIHGGQSKITFILFCKNTWSIPKNNDISKRNHFT